MKKMEKIELPHILPVKRGRDTPLRVALLSLAVGEGLFMSKEEWRSKNGPYYVVAHIKKTLGHRYEYGMKPDGSGWLFRRVA